MQVMEIHGVVGRCAAKGIERDVNLFMLAEGEVRPGDYVVVHVGYAIQKIDEGEARSAWELYDRMMDSQD